jgi:hypothetical protein
MIDVVCDVHDRGKGITSRVRGWVVDVAKSIPLQIPGKLQAQPALIMLAVTLSEAANIAGAIESSIVRHHLGYLKRLSL